MPWATVAAIAAPIVIGQITGSGKKRDSSAEVPGMAEYISQSLSAQRNAQMFAESAVNPNSEWFRNLSALFREGEEEAAMRGLNLADFNERRAIGRGNVGVIGERRDEARIGALMDAFRRAQISGRNSAHGALMNASKGEASAMGDPNQSFKILQQFGQAEQDRKQSQTDMFSSIFSGVLGGMGGGGSSLSGISGGVNPSTGYFNSGYYGLF